MLVRDDDGKTATLALHPQAEVMRLVEVRRALGRRIAIGDVSADAFEKLLAETYAGDTLAPAALGNSLEQTDSLDDMVDGLARTVDLLDSDDEAPIIRLINGMIAQALRQQASDIHIEPYENMLSVRLRIDGVLQEVTQLPAQCAPLVVSRLKVMARLDIAEKRLPQDGRLSVSIGGRIVDVRMSSLPARHGERVVLRLLSKEQGVLGVTALGMPQVLASRFERSLRQPNGIVLVTGPTGSGKTTTLYAGLTLLNDKTRNILTIEDPIEYGIDGIGQTQVNPRAGLSFAAGLRAILRQDPDVVLVGEIRDVETAQIAVQASLTGHLVLSTVHTNDAIAALTRLRDMGIESFLLASTVRMILAQRLVRRLCMACAEPRSSDDPLFASLPSTIQTATMLRPVGCPNCKHTGYKGRLAIYESVEIDDTLRRMINAGADEQTMAAHAFRQAPTLTAAGYQAAADGLTSLEEILRVCRREEDADGGL
ncbi:MAG: Flp pilus assembly complex ATPase component TadA [Gammaproteobacteria bacterium]|nr:Flp pilus assembly complex ATPase component TadA [Gammaproteobacteria bacterium]